MSLVIRDTSVVPDGGWKYLHPVEGKYIVSFNYQMLYPRIVETYTANQMPIPGEQEVISWMCENLYIGCYESETRQPLVNKFFLNLPQPVAKGCCNPAPLPLKQESV